MRRTAPHDMTEWSAAGIMPESTIAFTVAQLRELDDEATCPPIELERSFPLPAGRHRRVFVR